jgi:hypothetical protein
MREHEIEYYQEKGRKQEDFIRKQGNNISDATSTFINEKGYFVGGRINVQQAKKLFKEFRPVIEKNIKIFC